MIFPPIGIGQKAVEAAADFEETHRKLAALMGDEEAAYLAAKAIDDAKEMVAPSALNLLEAATESYLTEELAPAFVRISISTGPVVRALRRMAAATRNLQITMTHDYLVTGAGPFGGRWTRWQVVAGASSEVP